MEVKALSFRLFNCDHTFNLDKVEALIQSVCKKPSRVVKVDKTYFPLPEMTKLCEELEKEEGSHFEYAVFVVHAHESRLSINEKNAGIGYAKLYRALQKVTGDNVLIVIGGDDNYKDQGERDKSVLSRWAWHKICSQFSDDYVNGAKSFIFSWDESHHPIHEEALEFYLDPKKRGNQFVPRPRKVEQPSQDLLLSQKNKQEKQPMDFKQTLGKEFPSVRNKDRELFSRTKERITEEVTPNPLNETKPHTTRTQPNTTQSCNTHSHTNPPHTTHPHTNPTYTNQPHTNPPSSPSKSPDLHVLSFNSTREAVDDVLELFNLVFKQLAIAPESIKSYCDQGIDYQKYIMENKPGYLVLVSDWDYLEDVKKLSSYQVQRYQDIVKSCQAIGTSLIFMIVKDIKYTIQENISSHAVREIFRDLNQNMPSSDKLTILSWYKNPCAIHKDVLIQLLSPHRQDDLSTIPEYDSEKGRLKYRSLISYGLVVGVVKSDPPYWKPEALNLENYKDENDAMIEFWEKEDGTIIKWVHCPSMEKKLLKIAEGHVSDKMHSIQVNSYHSEQETYETMSEFIRRLYDSCSSSIRPLCQPMELISLLSDIGRTEPDYVMFSADVEVLQDSEVKKVLAQQGSVIKDSIKKHVGKGVILMLFGDMNSKKDEVASKTVKDDVKMLTLDIISPDKLIVMTCKERHYIAHQNMMKDLLVCEGVKSSTRPHQSGSHGAGASEPMKPHYLKAVISYSKIVEVLERIPEDWKPDKLLVNKVLFENKKKEKAYLEICGNNEGEIKSITVEKESKGPKHYAKKAWNLFSFSSDNKADDSGSGSFV